MADEAKPSGQANAPKKRRLVHYSVLVSFVIIGLGFHYWLHLAGVRLNPEYPILGWIGFLLPILGGIAYLVFTARLLVFESVMLMILLCVLWFGGMIVTAIAASPSLFSRQPLHVATLEDPAGKEVIVKEHFLKYRTYELHRPLYFGFGLLVRSEPEAISRFWIQKGDDAFHDVKNVALHYNEKKRLLALIVNDRYVDIFTFTPDGRIERSDIAKEREGEWYDDATEKLLRAAMEGE